MITVTRRGASLRVEGRLTVRSLFGITAPEDGGWLLPATGEALRAVFAASAGQLMLITSDCAALLVAAPATPHQADDAPIPGALSTPWRHQREAFHFAMARAAAMLACAMGTGKTATVAYTIAARGLRRVLVLCPKAVVAAWPGQIRQHIGAGWRVLALSEGAVKDRARDVARSLATDEPQIIVLNYDAARQPAMRAILVAQAWDLVVVDESHKIADPRTAINMLCQELRNKSQYRLALTGTPFKQTPLDIFGQYLFLDPTVFGMSYYRFREHYAEMGGFDGKQVIGLRKEHAADLMRRFSTLAYQVGADVLDLPPARHIAVPCDLGAPARAVYAKLDAEFTAEIEAGRVTAANGGVKVLRLQQITGGDLRTDEGAHIGIDAAKSDALAALLDALDTREPVVVFARFTYDLKAIELATAASRRRYAELSGDPHRAGDLQRWQHGDADVLGVQIQAGGTGIDLTRARYAIYYSVGYSLTDYEQSLARVHRPGQGQPVTYYHLIARDTIDERVYAALRARKGVIESLLRRDEARSA